MINAWDPILEIGQRKKNSLFFLLKKFILNETKMNIFSNKGTISQGR